MVSQVCYLRLISIRLIILLVLNLRLELLFECIINHLLNVVHTWIKLLLLMLRVISSVLVWIYSFWQWRVVIVCKLNAFVHILLLLLLLLLQFVLSKVNIVQKFKDFMLNLFVFWIRFLLLIFNINLNRRLRTCICRISLSKHLTRLKLNVILELLLNIPAIVLIHHLLLLLSVIVQMIINVLVVDVRLTHLIFKVHIGVIHEHACVSWRHVRNHYRCILTFFPAHSWHKHSTVSALTSLSIWIVPLFSNWLSLSLLASLQVVSAVNIWGFKWVLSAKSRDWRWKCIVVYWIP